MLLPLFDLLNHNPATRIAWLADGGRKGVEQAWLGLGLGVGLGLGLGVRVRVRVRVGVRVGVRVRVRARVRVRDRDRVGANDLVLQRE